MDGITAIRHLRARGDAKATLPVIVVTADTAVDLRDYCLREGADEVLFKPVAMDSLFDAIGRLLARRAGGMIG
jgi:DNA-binding response OmpR family regulator